MTFRIKMLMLFTTAVTICCALLYGCDSRVQKESEEAKVAKYLIALSDLNVQSDEDRKKAEAELAASFQDAFDGKGGDRFRKAIDELMPLYDEHSRKLAALEPPESMAATHRELVKLALDSKPLLMEFAEAADTKDKDEVRAVGKKFDERMQEWQKTSIASMKSAGFSSPADLERALERSERKQMPWYFALLFLFVGGAIFVGLLQLLLSLAIMPAVGVFAVATLMWQQRKFFAAGLLGALSFGALLLISSMAGVAVVAFAEDLMFPRTQLAPWFVYLGGGFTAFGMMGAGTREEGESSVWGCLPPLVCIAGYLWAAMFKGYLVGPWSWFFEIVSNVIR